MKMEFNGLAPVFFVKSNYSKEVSINVITKLCIHVIWLCVNLHEQSAKPVEILKKNANLNLTLTKLYTTCIIQQQKQ